MSIDYTFTDAENVERRPIDPGEYQVKITGFEFGMAKTGTDKLDLTFLVSELEVELIDSVYFTPRSQWKFDLVLKCFAPSSGNPLPKKGDQVTVNEDFVQKYLMGSTGKVTTHNEEYPIGSGNERSRIRVFHPDTRELKMPDAEHQDDSGQTNMLEEEGKSNVPF